MALDPDIRRAASTAARLTTTKLKSQAPVKTGALRNSVRTQVIPRGDAFTLQISYLPYGKFLDLGTGPYRTRPTNRRAWNPKPGKGKGGIKPRFWTTLDRVWRRENFDRLFQAAVKKIVVNTFRKLK